MNVKRTLAASIVTLAMCTAIVGGSTYALFSDEARVNISVNSGKIDVTAQIEEVTTYSMNSAGGYYSLEETEEQGIFINGGTAEARNGNLVLTNISPGDAVEFKLRVENNSGVQVKYRAKIVGGGSSQLLSQFVVTVNGEETESFYSYTTTWSTLSYEEAAEENVGIISVQIMFPINEYNSDITGADKSCTFQCAVEATQGNAIVSDADAGAISGFSVGTALEFKTAMEGTGDRIILDRDITLTASELRVESLSVKRTLRLILNGHTLTSDIPLISEGAGGRLLIRNGFISAPSVKGAALIAAQYSYMSLQNVTITSYGTAIMTRAIGGVSATVEVERCTINDTDYKSAAIASEYTTAGHFSRITVTDSTVNANGAGVLLNIGAGNCTLYNTVITGGAQAVIVRAGRMTIDGCKLISTCDIRGLKEAYGADYKGFMGRYWNTNTNVTWGRGVEVVIAGLVVGGIQDSSSADYGWVASCTISDTSVSVAGGEPAVFVYGIFVPTTLTVNGGCTADGRIEKNGTQAKIVGDFEEQE